MTAFPDGLAEHHAARGPLLHRRANPLSLIVLGGVAALGLSGVLGGGRSLVSRVAGEAAELSVHTPLVLRSGLFFESEVTVVARRPIADAVIALPPALWRDQTINSQVPAPGKEEAKDGIFLFHYGPLVAGERLTVKIDGQVNPPLTLGTSGSIALLDGERPLASVPLRMTVLP